MAGGGVKVNNINVRGGANGKTPTFKIENGHLYNSYDNGIRWNDLGVVKGTDGTDGQDGATGAKLRSQELVGQDAEGGNIYLQTFDDGTTATFVAPKGDKGDAGSGGGGGSGDIKTYNVLTSDTLSQIAQLDNTDTTYGYYAVTDNGNIYTGFVHKGDSLYVTFEFEDIDGTTRYIGSGNYANNTLASVFANPQFRNDTLKTSTSPVQNISTLAKTYSTVNALPIAESTRDGQCLLCWNDDYGERSGEDIVPTPAYNLAVADHIASARDWYYGFIVTCKQVNGNWIWIYRVALAAHTIYIELDTGLQYRFTRDDADIGHLLRLYSAAERATSEQVAALV